MENASNESAARELEIEKLREELSATAIRMSAYKRIIERYAAHINASEQKTVPQLKELVRPNDSAVQKTAREITSAFEAEKKASATGFHESSEFEYEYARDFLPCAKRALEFCKSLSPVHADLPVSYWLSPQEILELGAADPLDRAIFFCSLLQAIGCRSARVRMVQFEEGATHPFVLFEFEGKSFVADAFDKNAQLSGRENVTFESTLSSIKAGEAKYSKSLYEFNNFEFEEFEE